VTRLELAPIDDYFGRASPFKFTCGQYLYLNVPSIAPIEWHPFSISSAPSDGIITCNIKAAPGALESTFTGKLHLLALQSDSANHYADHRSLIVSVDAPYGQCLDLDAHDELLLVAGGIGFTPVNSIVRELRERMARGKCSDLRVHVMLAVHHKAALVPFLATLEDMAKDDFDGRCQLSIFVTEKEGLTVTETSGHFETVPYTVGRLEVTEAVAALAARSNNGLVFVCGPQGLAAAADRACLHHKVQFHREVFSF
jgi:NAD(P)H-flavin reductase